MNCKYHLPDYQDVLWAKKSDSGVGFEWLPLKQHLIDVTDVIKLLWEHWLSLSQRQTIIRSLSLPDEVAAKKLVGFLATTHDIGKATPVFQSRPSFYQSPDLDKVLLEKLEGDGFKGITEYYYSLMNPEKTVHAVAGQVLLESYGVSSDISSVVGAHHGVPVDYSSEISSQLGSYGNNYFQEHDSEHPVHRKWVETQKAIFDWALKINGLDSVRDLPSVSQPGQVLLSGLLIMSDWIASNEKYFPLLPIDKALVDDPDRRKQVGWEKWYETRPRIEEEHIDIVSGYEERFGFKPRDLQVKLFEVIRETVRPGIFIVEAPMGVGKTEAALMGVEQLSAKTKASGMFFGLPTQATSNGMFDRIRGWLEELDDEKKSLQLVHGKAALNDSYTSLARPNIYDEADRGVVVNEWFTGRKTAVLDDFVVGTVDQFLMTSLKQKHLALRHLGFSKKVIVIDEVHAYDAYMSQYLYRALRWMGAYRVPVIILSATLPARSRIELIKNYVRGSGAKWRDVQKPENWETNWAYPLITYSDGMSVKQFSDIDTNNHLVVSVSRLGEEDLIATLDTQLRDGGVAGVVVNTVKRAQAIAEMCRDHFGQDLVELLHSSFIATDRVEKEKRLLQSIGKGMERPAKKIIIGTQVIEQSLDIDFDLLVSDLAPIDLLIQRIGRLHRHSSAKRPKKLNEPRVYVLGTSDTLDFDPGSTAVYGDYLLIRTQLHLPETVTLPDDISPLVQAVYGDDESFVAPELWEKYDLASNEQKSLRERKNARAKGYLLGDPSFSREATLNGWLESKMRLDLEEKAVAQVRDTQETIEVIALQKYGNGYAFFGEERDLSTGIHDAEVQRQVSRHTLRLPLQFSTHYNIDQTINELEEFNRRYLASWQDSSWLGGMLGIVFDEDSEFILNGFRLKYCQRQGLTYEKMIDKEGGN